MTKQKLLFPALTAALFLSSGLAVSVEPTPMKNATQAQTQDQIYGSQLMTQQERAEHRTKMRAAKTAEEREQVRMENHERMQLRAKERGVTLPDEMPARGGGMGPGPRAGMGPGGGMGGMAPGGGMGPGGGRGR